MTNRKESVRKYYLLHKEEISKRNTEKQRERRIKNPELSKQRSRVDYFKHKEKRTQKHKEYYLKHRDEAIAVGKKKEQGLRSKFLEMYGNKCACCGETLKEFLTIEHKNGQKGTKKDSAYQAYKKAIQEYDPKTYEILCMNCNHAKGRYGYCPHSG